MVDGRELTAAINADDPPDLKVEMVDSALKVQATIDVPSLGRRVAGPGRLRLAHRDGITAEQVAALGPILGDHNYGAEHETLVQVKGGEVPTVSVIIPAERMTDAIREEVAVTGQLWATALGAKKLTIAFCNPVMVPYGKLEVASVADSLHRLGKEQYLMPRGPLSDGDRDTIIATMKGHGAYGGSPFITTVAVGDELVYQVISSPEKAAKPEIMTAFQAAANDLQKALKRPVRMELVDDHFKPFKTIHSAAD